eukprot:3975948-Pyramimonas_sp.AAC.1
MNLLAHPNVRVLARFARGTFAFLPPDHWAGGAAKAGTANWQVMVLEIANAAGRGAYQRGGRAEVEIAGRAMGARPFHQGCEDTGSSGRRMRWEDPTDSFVEAKTYEGYALTAPATPTLPAGVVTQDPTLRFPPGRRVFTDGSLITDVGVGAAYYSERTDRMAYVRVPEGEDINNAELTGLLQA